MAKQGRKKKVVDQEKPQKTTDSEPIEAAKPEIDFDDDHGLPKKELFRIDEVANYFNVSERTIRLWIEHGHLACEKIVGSIRVSRASILKCRFRKQ